MAGRSNKEKSDNVHHQLDIRIALLERWVREGAPKGAVPTSLTKARVWSDAAAGIERIGSSSSFVTTHGDYGEKVRRIDELRGALLRKLRPARTPAGTRIAGLEAEIAEAKRATIRAANQFVQKEIELGTCAAELRSARQDVSNLKTLLEREKETVKVLRKANAQLEAKLASGKVITFPSSGASGA